MTEEEQTNRPKKKIKTEGKVLTNIRRIELLWEKQQQTSKQKRKETWKKYLNTMHKEQIKKQKKEVKEKSWLLYREYKDFLEKNKKNWEKIEIEREIERKKRERLYRARDKQEKVKERIRERKLQKNIMENRNKLPTREKKTRYSQKSKERAIQNWQGSFWKLRNKEKKYEKRDANVKKQEKIQEVKKNLRKLRLS